MTLLEKLVLDAGSNGNLAGDFLKMSALDISASGFVRALRMAAAGDGVPELVVASYFEKVFCDQRRAFLLKEPLTAAAPEPGLAVAERIRRETLRWMQAAHQTSYVPIPLTPDETDAAIRAEVRALQLVPYPAPIREQFAAALGIKTEAPTQE